jgi:hypothetical protein
MEKRKMKIKPEVILICILIFSLTTNAVFIYLNIKIENITIEKCNKQIEKIQKQKINNFEFEENFNFSMEAKP